MKKAISILLSSILFFSTISVSAANTSFSDIKKHWAEETIVKWQDKGIVSGYPDGSFKPDNPVTRAELIKVLVKAFDLQEKFNRQYDYVDVDESAWYYPYLDYTSEYMVYNGPPRITFATEPYVNYANCFEWDQHFLPNNNALRLHASLAMARIKIKQKNLNIQIPEDIHEMQKYLNSKYNDIEFQSILSGFSPSRYGIPKNVKKEFEECWLVDNIKILEGTPDGYMWPYGALTRAGLLTMIDRVIVE
ncbi:MAG: S-layer homology domain-containing protein [bacterium]|nr:S-layer homology domain-containing protein [bacterium]